MTQEDIGLNSDMKEVVVFALLASEAINGNCNNVRVAANSTNIFGREKLLRVDIEIVREPSKCPATYKSQYLAKVAIQRVRLL